MNALEAYIRAMPKVELHLHLEGSIRPEILLQLAQKNGVTLPHNTLEGLRKWYHFRNFDHFVEIYIAICSTLQHPDDFTTITYDLAQTLAAQNVRYAEVTWTPGLHCRNYEEFLELLGAVNVGRQRAHYDFGIEIQWIPDISRNVNAEAGEMVAEWVSTDEAQAGGVVALGLGGPEVGHPPEKFEGAAAIARKNNLPCNPHAGETEGVASIWGALRSLQARRIGHGVRAIEDPTLIAYLVEHQIPLEVNPTSNLCLGVYPSYAQHPLRQLLEAGVLVTVNSDDPPMFDTTLTAEYLHAVQDCGLSVAQLEKTVLDALRVSYLSEERRNALLEEFSVAFAQLRPAIL